MPESPVIRSFIFLLPSRNIQNDSFAMIQDFPNTRLTMRWKPMVLHRANFVRFLTIFCFIEHTQTIFALMRSIYFSISIVSLCRGRKPNYMYVDTRLLDHNSFHNLFCPFDKDSPMERNFLAKHRKRYSISPSLDIRKLVKSRLDLALLSKDEENM